MRSTFYGMEVARAGLYTSQNQLNTTGHNISNVDTEGYTRQRLDTAAVPPPGMNVMFAIDNSATSGRGVESLTVEQIRDQFLDAKYRTQNTTSEYWATMTEEFEMIQQIYDSVLESTDTSANIFNAIDEFQTALNSLHEEPSSIAVRENLITKAEQLTDTFRYIYGKLETQHDDVNSTINVQVDQINDLAHEIAELNTQIFGYELTGAKANDLRDIRNLRLDELSGIINIEYYEDLDGYVTVTIGARKLVDRTEYNKLAVDPVGVQNQLDIVSSATTIGDQGKVMWANALGNPGKDAMDVVRITGGSLKAYLDMRDGATEDTAGIPYAAKKLNELAQQIAKEVNDLHRQGWTMPFLEQDALGTVDSVKVYKEEGGMLIGVQPGALTTATVTNADGKEVTYYESLQGINFFEPGIGNDYSKISAANFSLSAEILNNPRLIACSDEKMVPKGELNEDGTFNMLTGNNHVIRDIIKLADRKDELGNSDNYQDRVKALVAEIGTIQNHYKSMDAAEELRLDALTQQRSSVSGVSLDEEMTNIIRFNHAYNANARIITAIDEELNTLINSTGMVGR